MTKGRLLKPSGSKYPLTLGPLQVPILLDKSHSGWQEHPTKETSYSIRLDGIMIYFVLINIYRVG